MAVWAGCGVSVSQPCWEEVGKYPVAFVSGAALEEPIRLAMRLKVWTPAVAHGPAEGQTLSGRAFVSLAAPMTPEAAIMPTQIARTGITNQTV